MKLQKAEQLRRLECTERCQSDLGAGVQSAFLQKLLTQSTVRHHLTQNAVTTWARRT
jgi:uncharacterized protein